MDSEKLKKILAAHAEWLRGLKSGARANLTRANLSEADLSGVDLFGADLSEAIQIGRASCRERV